MNNNYKGFSFKLKLILVTLFAPSQQESHYTLSIINKYHQYNTSPFLLINKIIDLKQCAPIYVNMEENKQSLLKITLNSCQDTSSFDTQIDYKIIQIIINKGWKAETRKRRHILAFPLFGKSRSIVGEIKLKLSILPMISHEKTLQKVSNQKKTNRQIFFSKNDDDDYFQPVYSKFIKVKIDDSKEDSDQNIKISKQQIVPTTQRKPSIKNDSFEPFKEQISLIQLRDSNEGRINEQQQCEMVELANTANEKHKQDKYYEGEEIVDIPEDCRYLFQKINEINKRYAPLQKIPSQEQFSEDYSELKSGDNKLDSDLSEEQVSHPLQQVEQLLKQLDLIKFAQTLQQSDASKF